MVDGLAIKVLMKRHGCRRELELRPGLASSVVVETLAMWLIEAEVNVHARDHLQMRPFDRASTLPSLAIFKALIAGTLLQLAGGRSSSTRRRGHSGVHYMQVAAQFGRANQVLRTAAAAGVSLKKVQSLGFMVVPLLAYAAGFRQRACAAALPYWNLDERYEEGHSECT